MKLCAQGGCRTAGSVPETSTSLPPALPYQPILKIRIRTERVPGALDVDPLDVTGRDRGLGHVAGDRPAGDAADVERRARQAP